ncbi:hypothetical protein J2793_000582 [Paraburkholderia caledonica]|jgi:hypothetical protein|uniref:DUF3592 domain-containing protein n=1 Tax=Paraburkholderia caledonica TaxID=134536 RepID=A0AB73I571_9BURK|nr:hypothetical protein [Paraburkholderia caledonica]MDR6374792.1 hypothetical protein [Paraburkholderia caledonica]
MMALSRLRRIGVAVAVGVVGVAVVQYMLDARVRISAQECYSVTSKSGSYRAQSCVKGGNGNVDDYVGRLYDGHSGKLLARTDFDSMDGGIPEFMPDESAVIFRRGEGNGSGHGVIDIPPNWLDRLRANVP